MYHISHCNMLHKGIWNMFIQASHTVFYLLSVHRSGPKLPRWQSGLSSGWTETRLDWPGKQAAFLRTLGKRVSVCQETHCLSAPPAPYPLERMSSSLWTKASNTWEPTVLRLFQLTCPFLLQHNSLYLKGLSRHFCCLLSAHSPIVASLLFSPPQPWSDLFQCFFLHPSHTTCILSQCTWCWIFLHFFFSIFKLT